LKIWLTLVIAFLVYSGIVYLFADVRHKEEQPDDAVNHGWVLWQQKNCQSCHQLYGLGGYLGPDLTNTASNPYKGRKYMEIFIKNGTAKMPNFHLNDSEVSHIVQFLCWVDKSGSSKVKAESVHWTGTYRIDK